MKIVKNIIIVIFLVGITLSIIINYLYSEILLKNRTIEDNYIPYNDFINSSNGYSVILKYINLHNIYQFYYNGVEIIGYKDIDGKYFSCNDSSIGIKKILNLNDEIKVVDCNEIKKNMKEKHIFKIDMFYKGNNLKTIVDINNNPKFIKFYISPKNYNRKGYDYFIYSYKSINLIKKIDNNKICQIDFCLFILNDNWLFYEIKNNQ